jgi:hypothetical protein
MILQLLAATAFESHSQENRQQAGDISTTPVIRLPVLRRRHDPVTRLALIVPDAAPAARKLRTQATITHASR